MTLQIINIHAAKTQLSRLVEAAAAGEDIIIARAGKPLARLGPLTPTTASAKRQLGVLAGQLNVPADFDTPLPPAELDRFEAG
jgi:prevent-host-death family protein